MGGMGAMGGMPCAAQRRLACRCRLLAPPQRCPRARGLLFTNILNQLVQIVTRLLTLARLLKKLSQLEAVALILL